MKKNNCCSFRIINTFCQVENIFLKNNNKNNHHRRKITKMKLFLRIHSSIIFLPFVNLKLSNVPKDSFFPKRRKIPINVWMANTLIVDIVLDLHRVVFVFSWWMSSRIIWKDLPERSQPEKLNMLPFVFFSITEHSTLNMFFFNMNKKKQENIFKSNNS